MGKKTSDALDLEHITLLQCNIGGNPQARLAKGAVLRHLIDLHKPTLILLSETKRKREDIPSLPKYGFLTHDHRFYFFIR